MQHHRCLPRGLTELCSRNKLYKPRLGEVLLATRGRLRLISRILASVHNPSLKRGDKMLSFQKF